MTTNKPMTGEQLDELMTVAVNMQRDSEKAGDRPAAMFAYAVQVAVLELRKVRNDAAELEQQLAESHRALRAETTAHENTQMQLEKMAAENAGLKEWSPNPHSASMFEAIEKAEELMDDGMPELAMIEAFEILKMKRTPETDAFLAEVRAQESKRVYESILDNPAVTDMGSLVDWLEQNANDSIAFAAQLRKGVQS
ncbi:hypothetical protein [Enterobacter cloacae]|uniref:hypothetical protein n=1 Tax=Enterobacter cloacae TaxID=550 RepID=UPI000666F5D6|nr:hypothetical protein [Enterobacter cloacae]